MAAQQIKNQISPLFEEVKEVMQAPQLIKSSSNVIKLEEIKNEDQKEEKEIKKKTSPKVLKKDHSAFAEKSGAESQSDDWRTES